MVKDWHIGSVIAVSCWLCILPQVLFIIDVWSEHAGSGVLLLIGSYIAAKLVADRLPSSYYGLRRFERDGVIYERAGVRAFRHIVPDGDLANAAARRRGELSRCIDRSVENLDRLEQRGRLAERLHLMSLLSTLPLALFAASIGRPGWALVLFCPNVVFHLYPVMLQRYTRARLYALRAKGRV